jgi:PAS domain S-box-containing protein
MMRQAREAWDAAGAGQLGLADGLVEGAAGAGAENIPMSDRDVADEPQDQRLRESEARLRLALEAGRMGTWEWQVATNEVNWSPGLEAIHGLAPGTFEGTFADYQNDIHPEDRERVLGAIAQTLEHGADHHVEYRIVWPDGSIHWVEGRGKLVRDRSGAPTRMIGVCMDVTERKQAEERQQLLLEELNHRVRNTLAIIQAIAAQTLRATPDPAAFNAAFSARLAALARAHSLLTRELWQGAALRDIVAAALAPFGGDGPEAIRIDGPAVVIKPNAAVTLSLVLHELATNAAKHGALTTPQGRVSVAWRSAQQPGQPPSVELAWSERGGPFVSAPTREGFGSRLIAASAEQLGGEVAMRYTAEGFEARFRFPLPDNEVRDRPITP